MPSLLKSNTKQAILFERISNAQSELNWFVLYTKPRAERRVQIELASRNFEVFLPLKKDLKVWKNRQKKWVCQVLFPNYVFVKACSHELYRITQIPNIITFISCSGKPSIISTKEIERIKRIIDLGKEITVESNFTKGEKVKIVKGALIGYEGILIEQKGKARFGIQVKEISHTIFVDICVSVLEKC
jgi:transcription antitermination factor NusG